MADFENRPMSEFFPERERSSLMQSMNCRRCGSMVEYTYHSLHVEYHNSIQRQLWELQEQLKGTVAWSGMTEPKCLCGTLDNEDAVVDRHGRVWTICRDGGMVVRPAQGHVGNIEAGGLHWLEINHGPIKVVHKKAAT